MNTKRIIMDIIICRSSDNHCKVSNLSMMFKQNNNIITNNMQNNSTPIYLYFDLISCHKINNIAIQLIHNPNALK